ncbi:diguanylate cyclase (GGDEF) domain-containing protein [Amphritea atlantica]|uniref:diguanylate cyclase n=1 Tax=Amphritea atlantica TaxID=355243 RepID=A0A1H9CPA9_9GAMM|nr:GGDEF domain-containing protein [Amphritea atlantica]SEQ03009.1 diguanylate cyclase (GGDEF) domain-containing protein [Amphritea atlantica]
MMLLSDVNHYRRSVLSVLLSISIPSAAFFAYFNWTVDLKLYALIQVTMTVFWCCLLLIAKKTPNLHRWSLIYLCTFFSLVLLGIWVSSFRSGLFSWIYIFPVISYLLLGRKTAMWITSVFLLVGLSILGWRNWQPVPEAHWIALVNIGLCSTAIWAAAHVYESGREVIVDHLNIMAAKDPLTGLMNVRSLTEILTNELSRSKRSSEPLTYVFIDINDFKLINDTLGHQQGDQILIAVADAIKSLTRLEDHAFRYGGDEFGIIFANCTEAQAKNTFGVRIADRLRKYDKNLSISLGYAQASAGENISAEGLIQQADKNMYVAKHKYKEVRKNSGIQDIANNPAYM